MYKYHSGQILKYDMSDANSCTVFR